MLHPNASAVGCLDLGFEIESNVKQKLLSEANVVYNLGCDTLVADQEVL